MQKVPNGVLPEFQGGCGTKEEYEKRREATIAQVTLNLENKDLKEYRELYKGVEIKKIENGLKIEIPAVQSGGQSENITQRFYADEGQVKTVVSKTSSDRAILIALDANKNFIPLYLNQCDANLAVRIYEAAIIRGLEVNFNPSFERVLATHATVGDYFTELKRMPIEDVRKRAENKNYLGPTDMNKLDIPDPSSSTHKKNEL